MAKAKASKTKARKSTDLPERTAQQLALDAIGNRLHYVLCQLTCAMAVYWGDIDTHGFAILHRGRQVLPQLRSILMDERTLLAHRDLWGMGPVQCPNGSFDLLTPEERSVYEGLRANRWGVRLRMEQERVSWELALDALHEALRLWQRNGLAAACSALCARPLHHL